LKMYLAMKFMNWAWFDLDLWSFSILDLDQISAFWLEFSPRQYYLQHHYFGFRYSSFRVWFKHSGKADWNACSGWSDPGRFCSFGGTMGIRDRG
jgi:hypothetical protein